MLTAGTFLASNASKAKAMKYLSDKFMLDMLSRVQPYQAEILKTGRSAHVDAHYHVHEWDTPDHVIDFDFYVFEDTTLVKSFEFNTGDTEEQIEAVFASLVAYVHSL